VRLRSASDVAMVSAQADMRRSCGPDGPLETR
jgi:hypothetical protein